MTDNELRNWYILYNSLNYTSSKKKLLTNQKLQQKEFDSLNFNKTQPLTKIALAIIPTTQFSSACKYI